jgi:hypothetical protein
MEDLGWKGEAGVKPRSPKGRAIAHGLDARIHFQHTFIPAGDTPPQQDHGIYGDHQPSGAEQLNGRPIRVRCLYFRFQKGAGCGIIK